MRTTLPASPTDATSALPAGHHRGPGPDSVPTGRPGGRLPQAASGRLAGLSSLLVLLAGLVGVVSGLLPADSGRLGALARVVGLPTASAAAAGSVVAGLAAVLVARGLRRRQRRAHRLAMALLGASVVLHLVKGLDVEEAALCAATAAALWLTRAEFQAEPDTARRASPLAVLLGLAAVSTALGLVLLQVNGDAIVGPAGPADRLATVLLGLVGQPGPVALHGHRAPLLVPAVLGALGLVTVCLPLLLALRPGPGRVGLDASQRAAVHELLRARPDGDSLGYFALRPDKDLIFSPTGKAAVSYRVEAGVAVASGDPLGDPEAWPGAITAFLGRAAQQGWLPAVLGCSAVGGRAWSRAGLRVLEMGDEAVVDTDGYSLAGRSMRGVRQAVSRVQRAGYTARVRTAGELDAAELAELAAAADRWRDGPVERGFSMALGRIGADDPRCVVVTAERDGQLQALLHFVPWGTDGWSLDLMRRVRGSDNGVNELLISTALLAAPDRGVRRVSLNFAVFRGALEQGGRLGAGPVGRGWRGVLLLASRVWQIDSLYRFNDKFGPSWRPRYLCYRRGRDLPRVALAALRAEAFLPSLPFRQRPPGSGRRGAEPDRAAAAR